MEKLATAPSSSSTHNNSLHHNNNNNNNNNEDDEIGENERWESSNGDHKNFIASVASSLAASPLAIQFNVKQEEVEKTCQSPRNTNAVNGDSRAGGGSGGGSGSGGSSSSLTNGGGKDLKGLAKVVNQLTAIRAKELGTKGKNVPSVSLVDFQNL